MSALAEPVAQHATISLSERNGPGHMLALVQGDVVISTFPEDQTDAAIDLARVLCRALTQPIDLYCVCHHESMPVQFGASADTAGPGWTHLAHLHTTFFSSVAIEVHDPAMREKMAASA